MKRAFAVVAHNWPLKLAAVGLAVLVVVVLFVVVNLIVDLSYSAIDPRIRHEDSSPGAAG